MNNRSIVTSIDDTQQEVADVTMESLVYCSMCEEAHLNNTWCQLPGGIMYIGSISTGSAQ